MHQGYWYYSWQLWLLATGVMGIVCVLAAYVIWWWRAAGMRRHIWRRLGNIADRLLRDAVIPDGLGGRVTVDALLLRDGRLYVLDIRDVEGAIFGSDKMDQWTAMSHHRRFVFRNPLRPMQDRVSAVHALVPELQVVPRILFTAHGHFPKGRPQGVELLDDFVRPLMRHRKAAAPVLDARLQTVWQRLCEAAGMSEGYVSPVLSTGAAGAGDG
ncbi:MAG: NERD domain-containing protein [Gammaproteobacteria bacterium]|nr:NERD domain-containing protein [Gammaproteobacteria bacterium]